MAILSARALEHLLDSWRPPTGPAYAALADRIRLLVLDGRVTVGTRLPAERELAAALAVSRTTVTAAYSALRESGYLASLRGSGSVARLPARAPAPFEREAPGYLDLSKATMPTAPVVAEAAQRAAERLPAYLGESGFDPLGLPELRQAIADRYSARGLSTSADQVMVTIGAQHAIALLCRTLLSRGDRALVESPSYPHAVDALRVAGARLVPVAVSAEEGWDDDELEQAIRRTNPVLGYLMPDYHNPTGRLMPPAQRRRLAEIADRYGTVLIADETMGELGIHGGPELPPFAASGPAVSVGSMSKSVWGGLRLGWIRADRPTIQRLARARNAGDLGTPILEQLLVAGLLEHIDEVLAERRVLLRRGHDRVVAALADRFPQWRVTPASGGLTVWANLGAPVSSQLTLAARNEGLILTAGPRFGIDGAFERYLRIPYCYPEESTTLALDALERAWAGVEARPAPVHDDYLADVV